MGTVWFDDYPEISKDFKDLKIAKPPKILEAYWVDKNGEETGVLPYGSDKVGIYISGENLKGRNARLLILDSDWGPLNDEVVKELQVDFDSNEVIIYFEFTEEVFVEGETNENFHPDNSEDLLHVYFKVIIEDELNEEFCNETGKSLKVHAVRYIPRVMNTLGWEKGKALQEKWFAREKNDKRPQENNPVCDLITMDWVLSFPRAKVVYDNIFEQKIWLDERAKKGLLYEIKKMEKDGYITLPTEEGEEVQFGVTEDKIIDYQHPTEGMMKIPIFHKYYFQRQPFNESLIETWWKGKEALDDLFAALANFNFRLIALGKIQRENAMYKIKIDTIGVYISDSFDFIDDGLISQPLGYWDLLNHEVDTKKNPNNRYITNSSYQQYREHFDMGTPFIVYSNIKYESINTEFEVSLEQLD